MGFDGSTLIRKNKGLLQRITASVLTIIFRQIFQEHCFPGNMAFEFALENEKSAAKPKCKKCKNSNDGVCDKHAVTHIKSLYTTDEVIGIVGHELGHWKLNHVIMKVILSVIKVSVFILLFGILNRHDAFYEAFDFQEKPILIGIIIIYEWIFGTFDMVFYFAQKSIERCFEYKADAYAKQIGLCDQLCKALIKIHMENLIYPNDDYLYTAWNKSHPTLLQRLHELKSDSSTECV